MSESRETTLNDSELARSPSTKRDVFHWPKYSLIVGTMTTTAVNAYDAVGFHARADVFALGCLLYECVAGRPPFGSRPFADAALAHLAEEPPDPSTVRRDLPREFWTALRQGMAKNPDDRPPTATAYALMIKVSARPP